MKQVEEHLKSRAYHDDLYNYVDHESHVEDFYIKGGDYKVGTWYECITVSEYIAHLVFLFSIGTNLSESTIDRLEGEVKSPEEHTLDEFTNLLDGVYNFEINNNVESHGFVLWKDEHTVKIYNGYGGVYDKPSIIHMKDYSQWISKLISLEGCGCGDVEFIVGTMNELFGIPHENLRTVYSFMDSKYNEGETLRLTRICWRRLL